MKYKNLLFAPNICAALLSLLFLPTPFFGGNNDGEVNPPNSANEDFYEPLNGDLIIKAYPNLVYGIKDEGKPTEEKILKTKIAFTNKGNALYIVEFRQIKDFDNNPWCPWLGDWQSIEKKKVSSFFWSYRKEGSRHFFHINHNGAGIINGLPDSLVRIRAIKPDRYKDYIVWAYGLRANID
jgi:hypothetical protein